MYITREQFKELRKKYSTVLVIDDDITDALYFVQDLLELEADAIEKSEPTATESIRRLSRAAYEVFSLNMDIQNEEFNPV